MKGDSVSGAKSGRGGRCGVVLDFGDWITTSEPAAVAHPQEKEHFAGRQTRPCSGFRQQQFRADRQQERGPDEARTSGAAVTQRTRLTRSLAVHLAAAPLELIPPPQAR